MDIQPIFRCAVGIDIHLALICVCIIIAEPGLEPVVHRREFGGFQRDRRAMADWIASFKPDIVVMERTGIYWKSPYAALEKVGIRAQVVNARQVKKVPGRKTDTSDAEWLALLARAGLLRGSFIPPERLHTLRQVSRHHQKITAMRAMEKNRRVKVLSDAGIRITAVVSDPHGVAATAIYGVPAGRWYAGTSAYASRAAPGPARGIISGATRRMECGPLLRREHPSSSPPGFRCPTG
jgi:transposase